MATAEQNKLFDDNFRLVNYTLNSMNIRPGNPIYEDCFSWAQAGLFDAVKRFDSEKSKFSTFAMKCIKTSVARFLRSTRAKKRTAIVVSLEQPLAEDKEGNKLTLGESIASADNPLDETIIEEETLQESLAILVAAADKRNQEIYLRWINGEIQMKIAEDYGITQMNVSRLITRLTQRMQQIYTYMEGKMDKPKRSNYSSDKEYRAAYSRYYYERRKSGTPVEVNETPMLSKVIKTRHSLEMNEERKEAIAALRKERDNLIKKVQRYDKLIELLEEGYD